MGQKYWNKRDRSVPGYRIVPINMYGFCALNLIIGLTLYGIFSLIWPSMRLHYFVSASSIILGVAIFIYAMIYKTDYSDAGSPAQTTAPKSGYWNKRYKSKDGLIGGYSVQSSSWIGLIANIAALLLLSTGTALAISKSSTLLFGIVLAVCGVLLFAYSLFFKTDYSDD